MGFRKSNDKCASIAVPDKDVDDDCTVSCIDWYGEARPFFIGDRVFALIDYELIEAAGYPSSIVEVG